MSAESPFLPGTHKQWAWDSTSLGLLKSCPRKYQYTMVEGWRAGANTSPHLLFGGWYASALEHYHKHRALGASHDDALIDVVTEALQSTWIDGAPWESGDANKTRSTLIRTIVWYLDTFEHDACATWHLADGKPAVELSFRFEAGDGIWLCGHLDRVVEYQGDIYVTDNKTTKTTITPRYFDQFEPNTQMTLYTLASRVVFGAPVRGVIIDAAQIAVGFSRFERGYTFRNEEQLDEFVNNTHQWVAQAHAYAEAGYWPMNESSCSEYGGCSFRDICAKAPAMRQRFLESNFVHRPWNPLEVR